MKHFLTIFLICIFLFSCATTPEIVEPERANEITIKYLQPSAYKSGATIIGSTSFYNYIGKTDFSDEKALRRYDVWENKVENKYIMIYHLVSKQGEFPKDLEWVDRKSSLFFDDMRAAYKNIAGRAYVTLEQFQADIPKCFIMAVETHINNDNDEAIMRILIAPDEGCTLKFWNTINELDRVTLPNPLK